MGGKYQCSVGKTLFPLRLGIVFVLAGRCQVEGVFELFSRRIPNWESAVSEGVNGAAEGPARGRGGREQHAAIARSRRRQYQRPMPVPGR